MAPSGRSVLTNLCVSLFTLTLIIIIIVHVHVSRHSVHICPGNKGNISTADLHVTLMFSLISRPALGISKNGLLEI